MEALEEPLLRIFAAIVVGSVYDERLAVAARMRLELQWEP
jgi:hypothetical protein